MPLPPMMPSTDLVMFAPDLCSQKTKGPERGPRVTNCHEYRPAQCTSDHTFFLVKYISPASTIRKNITWMPMRLRSTRCGSAAHIRKAETSWEYCSRVGGEPSSKVTWPACSGGRIAVTWPGKYLL